MSCEYLRVLTFDDSVYDLPRTYLVKAKNVKDRLQTILNCPSETIKLLHAGREINDEQSIEMIDQVYACMVPVSCECDDEDMPRVTLPG